MVCRCPENSAVLWYEITAGTGGQADIAESAGRLGRVRGMAPVGIGRGVLDLVVYALHHILPHHVSNDNESIVVQRALLVVRQNPTWMRGRGLMLLHASSRCRGELACWNMGLRLSGAGSVHLGNNVLREGLQTPPGPAHRTAESGARLPPRRHKP